MGPPVGCGGSEAHERRAEPGSGDGPEGAELMWQRILIGAAAGALATLPQSAVVWGMKQAGLYRRTPPPEKVAEEVTRAAVDIEKLPEPWQMPVKLVEHFGFGTTAGAAFGLLTTIIRPNAVTGVLVGLAVWKASYDGWIPAARIMPPPEEDEEGRVLAMVAAHVVYGLALGVLVNWWTSKR